MSCSKSSHFLPGAASRARPVWRVAGVSLAIGVFAVMGGCSSFKDAMGISKHPPDEFAVVTKAPLIVPPDFNLMPPKPTVEEPRDADPQAEAIQALFPDHKVAPPSQSEAMLIKQSGGDTASSDIRSKIGGESTEISNRGADTSKILYDDSVSVPGQPKAPEIERRKPVDVEQTN
jgi:Protein of unknown function (DUF3035)